MNPGADAIEILEHDDGVEFAVKVVPGSSRNKIVGVWETALRVAVAAPPEGGKANKEVVRLLADAFGVKRGDVTITRGQTQPQKRVHIAGISVSGARRVVAKSLEAI